jgi:hypothetical protein
MLRNQAGIRKRSRVSGAASTGLRVRRAGASCGQVDSTPFEIKGLRNVSGSRVGQPRRRNRSIPMQGRAGRGEQGACSIRLRALRTSTCLLIYAV